MSVYLDSFALLAWLQDEPGADITEGFLGQAASGQGFQCCVSAINVGEVYYRLYRTRGAEEADTFWEEAWQGFVPLTVPVQPVKTGITPPLAIPFREQAGEKGPIRRAGRLHERQ